MRGEDAETRPRTTTPKYNDPTLSRLDRLDEPPAVQTEAVRFAAAGPVHTELLATDRTKVTLQKTTNGPTGPAQAEPGPVREGGSVQDPSGPVREGQACPVR
ncbi:hypothetical protein [Peterkaempfera bronchialis]|nr:hypothetical protein [Peterkaempfera bronchialis]